MKIRANGRSAIIAATTLAAIWASPVLACETSDCQRIVLAQASEAQDAAAATDAPQSAEPAPTAQKKGRHARHASRKADKHAKASAAQKDAGNKVDDTDKSVDATAGKATARNAAAGAESGKAGGPGNARDNVWPSVADANAQMIGAPTTEALPAADKSAQPLSSGDTLSTSDQSAKAATNSGGETGSQVVASDELNDLDRAASNKPASSVLRPTSSNNQLASASSNDTWNQASMIGKIFIAVGGLLTLASAARMFIA
ncbi:hypothetical protein JQ557_32035 [Bradyrhizobium sp. U87765 SZCCT0131]|uniref:hypothetical protein n=1 Tax=unclassified Bradyrhizobium TaxID=2631580 RepID=UPI001BA44C83|nr:MULTISPECIES: hypothetical protein [unclassified Bradyrhizobium]MBR1222668.1 hypothetical protein [Bradyrhizobium sp. U87765 SZCCT0131]MBR1265251.1 hypothetical protein [Bradyrhizobium sp. U87765 SZCCT0134]MBR1302970.1 hypothetical protein [Bradyrhizobium sp. U87765 SZCCT0110]MBR1323668.1 hypothetical protein [Bradyrhizobium sp. U87765 SZCCT0109]MBR1346899.1 hypothetical protein [Bradyrhizobium sp. U87765 SZCCT0048]